jgi:ABC-type nitrate/sulfonate/bicarbonate transport system substrate-binding protein
MGYPAMQVPAVFARLGLACCTALGFGWGTAHAAPLTPLRFVYDWPVPDFGMVPVAVGVSNGFYEKHGLKLSILFPPDAQTTARMLATDRADVGFEPTTDIIFAANQGVPVVAIANFVQHNTWCLIGRPGEPIDMSALKGKSIGIFTDSWTKVMMGFVVQKAGIGEADVRQIIVQDDDIPLLLSKKLDIATNVAAYGIAEIQDNIHQQPTLACGDTIGVPDIPVWSYTGSPAWLSKNATTAQAFLAATAEATAWSTQHPEEAAKIFQKAYPASGTSGYAVIGWKETLPGLAKDGQYFTQTDKQWTDLAAAIKGIHQIPDAKPASTYYTNAYIPADLPKAP